MKAVRTLGHLGSFVSNSPISSASTGLWRGKTNELRQAAVPREYQKILYWEVVANGILHKIFRYVITKKPCQTAGPFLSRRDN